jgi:potassium efflux system protein
MDATWAGRLAALGALLIPFAVRGDESAAPETAEVVPNAPASLTPSASGPGGSSGEDGAKGTKAAAKAPAPEVKVSPRSAEARAVRAQTAVRLKRLTGATEKDAPAGGKALREVLEERLHWLDEWEKAEAAHRAAEHPEPSPERQAAEGKADLERVKALLDQAAKDPQALLPSAFRGASPGAPLSDAARAEMKDALDAAKNDLKDWTTRLEKLRAESAGKPGNATATLRAERDKIFQRVATLKTRNAERTAAVDSAKTREEAELARERLVNFEWESRVEDERLQVQEALMALEAKRAELAVLNLQVFEAHALLATKALERMQTRYRAVTDRQERDLQRKAATEQKRAASSDDPLERYRARRSAELLELEAQVLKDENALATSPFPSLEEQKRLADRADADFASIKHLLDDGKVSHLDALRLNNDFRRIGPERARIKARELTAAAAQLTFYEGALSRVELDLINDSRIDRLEHESLLELLPKMRHAEAMRMFQDLEAKQALLLERRRLALEKLARRAEDTHGQIQRRLRTLDDHYGFIRTHIFWVRDQDPVGAATLAQGRDEVLLVGRALARMALEAGDRTRWGWVSAEFVVGLLSLVGLPWPLRRVWRTLGDPRSAAVRRPLPGERRIGV